MNIFIFFKRILKFNANNSFFIISFTFAILTFSVGSSIVSNEKYLALKFNPSKNKELHFNVTSDIKISAITEILKNENITLKLYFYDKDKHLQISTEFISNSFSLIPDMKSGNAFTLEDFNSSESIGISSSSIEDISLDLKGLTTERTSINRTGTFYQLSNEVIVPKKTFLKLLNNHNINFSPLFCLISGEEKDVASSIALINNYIKELDSNNKLDSYGYIREDRSLESAALFQASIIIIIITLINSVILSSLWVESNKKEIALRKAIGAKDNDIFLMFFGELSALSFISAILALSIHYLITLVNNGYIFNLNISLNISTFIYSLILSIATAFIVALPVIKKVSKLQPSILLRRN